MLAANPYHDGAPPRNDLAALVAAVRAAQGHGEYNYQHGTFGGPRSSVGGVMAPTQLVCRGATS